MEASRERSKSVARNNLTFRPRKQSAAASKALSLRAVHHGSAGEARKRGSQIDHLFDPRRASIGLRKNEPTRSATNL